MFNGKMKAIAFSIVDCIAQDVIAIKLQINMAKIKSDCYKNTKKSRKMSLYPLTKTNKNGIIYP